MNCFDHKCSEVFVIFTFIDFILWPDQTMLDIIDEIDSGKNKLQAVFILLVFLYCYYDSICVSIYDKGYLLDVKGYINTNTLMDDLSSNFSLEYYT